MIKKFIHGDKKTDQELFCLIGEWAVSEDVHETLGTAITSRAGDVWHISIGSRGADGFAQTRIMKNKKAHIRYMFFSEKKTYSALLKEIEDMAQKEEIESIFTNDREDAEIWKTAGFTKGEKPPRGSFCRWEKNLS